jgi:hypothetical protein
MGIVVLWTTWYPARIELQFGNCPYQSNNGARVLVEGEFLIKRVIQVTAIQQVNSHMPEARVVGDSDLLSGKLRESSWDKLVIETKHCLEQFLVLHQAPKLEN